MAKYVIDSETLEGLGDAIRSVTGTSKKFTPEEMIEEVKDILNAATFVLVDETGNEYTAAYVDSDVVITAGPNDIRKGCTAITSEGMITGDKVIPSYHTSEGYAVITKGSEFSIPMFNECYDFTRLQCIICPLASGIAGSVSAEKVTIGEYTYNVNSTEAIGTVVRDSVKQAICLGITNDSDSTYLLRYFTYKEIY